MKSYLNILAKGAAVLALTLCSLAFAGGFVELDTQFDDDSHVIDNLWWPLPEGAEFVYTAMEDDECIVSVMTVLGRSGSGEEYKLTVNDTEVRTVRDAEVIDHDEVCDGQGDTELLEITLDWYAQDEEDNIWYFGEHTISLDTEEEDCDHWTDKDDVWGMAGCLDGAWEAGEDIAEVGSIAEEGIIMLTVPEKGQFYFQEYYEDEATDMGKVLNFKDLDTDLFGTLSDCVVIKEWVPLDPGNTEHKYYCYGYGLMAVAGLAGGPTIWTDLFYTNLSLPIED